MSTSPGADDSSPAGLASPEGTATADVWTPSPREQERAAYRAARARRSLATSTLSTVVVVTVVVAAVVTSPGWPRVKATYFSWDKAVSSFPAVLDGIWLNIRITVICGVLIAVVGLLLAVLRTVRGPVWFPARAFATAYVDFFRGMPLLLVLLLLGYGAPALNLTGLPTSVLFWGCASLVLTYSAYVAEVFRAGIESIHPSQRAAARSLGLTYAQSLRHVVLPQAVRRVVPPLMNDFVSLQKDSGLVSILGVVDGIRAAQIETASDFNYTPYVVAGALFLVLTIPLARLTDHLARRQGYIGTQAHL